MRSPFLVIVISWIFAAPLAHAQNGTWTWVKGSSGVDPSGNFGVQGIPALTNEPPALYEACEWTDLNGDFWVFGGGSVLGGESVWYGDLWRYQIATNTWTWMKGPGTPDYVGNYGVQGVPAATNLPSARGLAFQSWVSPDGDLWMFGGMGYDSFGGFGMHNDLWRYTIATNTWTWMKGPSTLDDIGTYTTFQTPDPTNNPCGRNESRACWVGLDGTLWLFGGLSTDVMMTSVLYLDDMWSYDPATNNWTWWSGGVMADPAPVHGTLQVPAPANTPGGRGSFACWTAKDGTFWLYGGLRPELNSFPTARDADMWRYDPSTHEWTWMAGVDQEFQSPTLQDLCVWTDDHPGPSYEDRSTWTDPCGRFWHFGGTNADNEPNNSLWVYDPILNQFLGVQPTGAASFGVQGVAAPTNRPLGLHGANAFYGSDGALWMFGGLNNTGPPSGRFNTLWRFEPDPECPLGTLLVNADVFGDSIGCAPFTYSPVVIDSVLGSTYIWDLGEPGSGTTTTTASNSYTYNDPGAYEVVIIATNPSACAPDTFRVQVNVLAPPVLDLGPDTLLCTAEPFTLVGGPEGPAYTWNTGASSASITVDTSGTYVVRVIGAGCIGSDTVTVRFVDTDPLEAGPLDLCGRSPIVLDAGERADRYRWSTGDTTRTVEVDEGGFYSVEVIIGPCTIIDEVEVIDDLVGLFAPNAFTPNGDGINEVFRVEGVNISEVVLTVYDRWGEVVFTGNTEQGWDGFTKEGEAPLGIYAYTVEFKNGCTGAQEVRPIGHIALIR